MTKYKKSGLPKYCVAKKGHLGRIHYYYQRKDFRVPLPSPDAPDFWDEYNSAESRLPPTDHRIAAEVLGTLGSNEKEMRKVFGLIERGAKQRAKRSGREYSLPKGWLYETLMRQQGRCAISGVGIRRSQGRFDRLGPSIDRIDSSVGYTPQNCHVVALGVNIAKGSMSLPDFVAFCKVVASYQDRTKRERIKNLEHRFSTEDRRPTNQRLAAE